MAITCERIRCETSSTKASTALGWSMALSRAARAGAVTAGCLSARGLRVVGVDVSASKVEDLRRGKPPIIEPQLEERLAKLSGGVAQINVRLQKIQHGARAGR